MEWNKGGVDNLEHRGIGSIYIVLRISEPSSNESRAYNRDI
eukprot:SAG22_NODE_19223_length_277_cov_0.578652_1_plen_40_part_10